MIAEPLVQVCCAVCGRAGGIVVCPVGELKAQREYLRRFHRRRLRPASSPEALEERAEFTQAYATDVVACHGCGLVYRNPRPEEGAITRAYSRDEYGRERLAVLFESQVELFRPKARRLRRL